MKKIFLLLVVMLTFTFSVNAQTSSYPWVIGTGVNFVDHIAPQLKFGRQLTDTNWEGSDIGYPFGLYASRFIGQGFSVTLDFNTINLPSKNVVKYGPNSSTITYLDDNGYWGSSSTKNTGLHIGDGRMFYGHISAQYNFLSTVHERRLKNDKRKFVDVFDPYIIIGLGATNMYEDDGDNPIFFSQQTGVGLNFWMQKNVAVYAEGDYTFIPQRDDYMSYKFGLKIRFGKDKDIDKDGIQNKYDKCPEVPGPKEFDGCPDTDGDGIPDHLDQCPDVPGPKEFDGCPDTDGDGVPDHLDDCPKIPGPKEFNGCPDRDGDGIPDFEDSCPDEPGLPEFKGCPDTDGDGVPDHKDKCPEEPGLAEFDGCPDTDGDGIPDHKDKCPDMTGLAEFDGCPDTDGDGIPDYMDACPDEAGLAEFNGCPDRDGDGIPDRFDNCPDEAGLKEFGGCPKTVIEEIEKELAFNAENIYFETGKSTIRAISYPNLTNIINILSEYPNIRLKIEGHTDNTGGRELNLKLSEDRAFEVMKYFTERGIPASRFQVNGYGPDRPVATNETSDGRAKNRRTEIHLIKE